MRKTRMRKTRMLKARVGIIAHVVLAAIVVGFTTTAAITVYSLADLSWLFGEEPDTSGAPVYVIQVKHYGADNDGGQQIEEK